MPKNLVVCCDGTWNTPDQHDEEGKPCPTNVVHVSRAVLPTTPDGTPQIVFYDQGVGTDRGLDRLLGGGVGIGLTKNVEDAYRFLCHNYSEGDRIFLFGFSRGAYTARSTAGFIRNCGLLRKRELHRIPEAHAMYSNRAEGPDAPSAVAFRQAYSHETELHFLGVWDTVGSLGIPVGPLQRVGHKRFEFHDVTLSRQVRNAFQALALGEQRKPFAPSIWSGAPKGGQTVEQAWFRGVHSDVGGGYPEAGLSNVAFHWMKEKAQGCGLVFDEDYCTGLTTEPSAQPHDSMTWFYQLMGRYVRPRLTQPTESLHPSAA